MKTFTIAAILLALVAAPALAQQRGPKVTRTDAQKQQDAEIDRAYQRVMQSTKDKGRAAPADPWGKVRPAGTAGDKR